MEEGLQGPIIKPYWFGEEYLDVESSSEKEALGLMGYVKNTYDHRRHSLIFQEEEEEEEEEDSTITMKMPFMQMLQQSVESPVPLFSAFKEPPPSFQFLLMLQHQKSTPWLLHTHRNQIPPPLNTKTNTTSSIHRDGDGAAVQTDHQSCLTTHGHGHGDVFHSPQETLLFSNKKCCISSSSSSSRARDDGLLVLKETISELGGRGGRCHDQSPQPAEEERSRRKKRRQAQGQAQAQGGKNKEEVESQRMTHIAVERNRRRQMNDHLNSLRSLMPPSYIQRGDQASIIGGAIDFVKELEQLLESLEAQKRMRKLAQGGGDTLSTTSSCSSSSSTAAAGVVQWDNDKSGGEGMVKVKVIVIQNHVNMKIECDENRPGQLLKAIVSLEQLRLTVLHLNITTFQTSSSSSSSVHYSFNLKVEDDCRVGSAAEIERSVHGIFNGSRADCLGQSLGNDRGRGAAS